MMYLGKDAVAIAKETGAQFVKGSFTVPNDVTKYTINFGGKSFSKYLFLIEMTEESKTLLINSGIDASRAFAFLGRYPFSSIGQIVAANNVVRTTYNPVAMSTSAGNGAFTCNATSITHNVGTVSDSGTYFFKGYTYNYYIVEIK